MATETVATMEKLCGSVETLKVFCYLGDRLNATGDSEAVVMTRTKIAWIKFRECREMLYGKGFIILRLIGKVL